MNNPKAESQRQVVGKELLNEKIMKKITKKSHEARDKIKTGIQEKK